tara:strand:+ start:163 stop:2133 length:1971 start_codon:yes stop_codon:yes gene_type:complete
MKNRIGPFSYDIRKTDYSEDLDKIILDIIKLKSKAKHIDYNVSLFNKEIYENGNYNITFYIEYSVSKTRQRNSSALSALNSNAKKRRNKSKQKPKKKRKPKPDDKEDEEDEEEEEEEEVEEDEENENNDSTQTGGDVWCYDFDGVIHTFMNDYNITQQSQHPNHDFLKNWFIKHPLFLFQHLFGETINDMKQSKKNGKDVEIYIVSSNDHKYKEPIETLFKDYLGITLDGVYMNIQKKEDQLKTLKCTKFVDDSCTHIKDVYNAHKNRKLTTLEELYWTIPTDKVYFKIDLKKNDLNICNQNSTNKWGNISRIEKLDGIEKHEMSDYKQNAFSILTYNVLYETFYLKKQIRDYTKKKNYDNNLKKENMDNIIELIGTFNPDIMVLCEAKPFATGKFGDKVANLKGTDIPTYINSKLKSLNSKMKLYENDKINPERVAYFCNQGGTFIYCNEKFTIEKDTIVTGNLDNKSFWTQNKQERNNSPVNPSTKSNGKPAHQIPCVDGSKKGNITGGRPFVGVKLIHKESSTSLFVIGGHLGHNYKFNYFNNAITEMLKKMTYNKGDKLLLMGDFNEYFNWDGVNKITIGNLVTLKRYKDDADKTCCGSDNDPEHNGLWSYPSDVIYSNFGVKAGVCKTLANGKSNTSNCSDHYPLFGVGLM